jgi:alpha/beta superfamily hydrolase
MAVPATRTLIAGAAGRIEVGAAIPHAPRAVALIAHPHPLYGGTMDNKVITTLAKAYTDAGIAAFRFNFRGVGATEGVHDEGRGEVDDLLRVAAHAQETVPRVPLHLAGFSFGGAVVTHASDHLDFQQLILVAPGFRRIAAHGMGATPDPNDPSLGAPGRHTTANTMIVHGDRDETVPLADSLAWAAAREVPVVVVPGGEHFFHRKLHVLREAVARWIK